MNGLNFNAMQNNTYDKKVLLYSSGMDSWLIDRLWKPDVKIYVDMKTEYSENEIFRLPADVIIEEFPLTKWEREDKIIPLRNLYLIGLATNYGNEICLGATAGDRVLDKSFAFGHLYEELLNYLYSPQHWTEGRKITINLDYKKYTKTELIHMFVNDGGDIKEAFNSSFSCYHPNGEQECWACKPCFRKFVAFAMNDYPFEKDVIRQNIEYIKKDILPEIQAGKYGRKEEEKEILTILKKYE